jgi:hypothetical protein
LVHLQNPLKKWLCLLSGNRLVNNRAVFYATAAPGTKIHVDTARTLAYLHLEIALLAGNALHFREGNQFNVDVPADLDQFGRDDSHGTVIGREGLVKLRHHPSDGPGLFNQVDIITGIGQIQGRLHPGYPAADNHYRTRFVR